MATDTVEAKPARVGIYGGAFDPVHHAHTALARAALEQFSLREIIFVPAGDPPHRTLSQTSQQDRLAMLGLAIEGCSKFVLDDWEFRQPSTTYTYETLQHFCRSKSTQYFFLMGEDSLLEFTSWHRWEAILQLCHLAVAKRPGLEAQKLPDELRSRVTDFEVETMKRSGNIYFIKTKAMTISSTSFRRSLSQGKAEGCDGLHPAVTKYIQDNGLYQNV